MDAQIKTGSSSTRKKIYMSYKQCRAYTYIDLVSVQLYQDTEKLREVAVEGPIRQKSVAKLAVLDILANSTVTIGFSMIGSGVSIQGGGVHSSLDRNFSAGLTLC